MDLKAFIFDLDGTLGDTLPLSIKSFQTTFKRVTGKNYNESEIVKFFGRTEEGIVKNIYPDKWQECLDIYLDIYQKNHHLCPKVFDGIFNILDYLRNKNFKIAIVTGKGKPSADITLEYFDISEYFEYVETGSPDGSIKPECIKRILEKWNLQGENVAYIGDSPSDIVESRKAGVIPIAVTWASTTNKEILAEEKPYKIFSKPDEFMDWLESLN